MKDNELVLDEMRQFVKSKVSPRRYEHILRVESEAAEMARIFLKDKSFDLRVAAIFHDVTKDIYFKEQLQTMENICR